MILKNLFFVFFILTLVTASDPHFGTDLVYRPLPPESKDSVRELPWMTTRAFDDYLSDHDQKVSDLFSVSPYFRPMVHFWFLIYTQFESSHAVIHDKNNLSLIYKVLDFSPLHEKELPKNTVYVLQQKITSEKLSQLKDDLHHLARNPFSLDSRAKNIYRMLKNAGLSLPLKKLERSAFFNMLRENIRSQTGQKNFIQAGMIRSLPYQHFMRSYFSHMKLPHELLAIPFLESSFNPKAESKVAALGVWQFMPLIGSYYLPKRTNLIDYRSNVALASIAAAFLMSENIKIMKRWDLAVTAYNSGTKHLLQSKRELASHDVDLEDIIKHSESENFGFASKNFYSEFLALAHTIAYREQIYRELHKHERTDVDRPLHIFMSKCGLRLDKVLSEEELDDVLFHNDQIIDFRANYPKGLIVTAKSMLPKSKFLQLNFSQITSEKPKDWMKYVARQSCSTR